MNIKTRSFGILEITESDIYNFPEGILGFPDHKKFALINMEVLDPLKLLQSCDEPELAFIVCDPNQFVKDYVVRINKEAEQKLDFKSEKEKQILSTLTFGEKREDTTVNLKGPLVFNLRKKIGAQLVLEDSRYVTKHKIFGDKNA